MPFPTPDLTGWGGPQSPGSFSAPIPQYILDAIGPYDQSKYRWDQQSMSLIANDGSGSYNYSHLADPSLGTNVITYPGLGPVDMVGGTSVGSADPYGFSGGQVTNFSGAPFTGFAGGGNTFISDDPNAIDEYQHDARTRNLQGVAQIGALVAGGAALNGLGGAAAGGGGAAAPAAGSGGAATTFPLAGGGPIAGSAIPGVTSGTTAAGATAAGIVPAVASGGKFANMLDKWLPGAATGVNTLLGMDAAGDAADAEAAGLQAGIDEQKRQFDLTRADWQPWMDTGKDALTQLNDPLNHFQKSPDYEFIRGEGTRDIGNSWAAAGGSLSGNAMKALTEFNDNLAKSDFNNWFNRQLSRAGLGTTGTNVVTNTGNNTSTNVSNALANQGVSRASGVIGKRSALAGGINEGVSNWLYRRRAA